VSRKKKALPILEKITITDVAAEGKALAKVNDMVVFVPYVVPGDVVDLQVKRKKNKYAEAVAVKFHEYSQERAVPFCQHYGVLQQVTNPLYFLRLFLRAFGHTYLWKPFLKLLMLLYIHDKFLLRHLCKHITVYL